MKKRDLTQYSDNELSDWVFNDEGLYRNRRLTPVILKAILQEYFIFTDDQWDQLLIDLEQDEVDNEI